MQGTHIEIYFDGGCPPSTSLMSTMVMIEEIPILEELGKGTSNQAEWLAAQFALELSLEKKFTNIRLIGDSEFVILAMNDKRVVHKPHLKPIFTECIRIVGLFRCVQWQHIARAKNPAGIAMEKFSRGRPLPFLLRRHRI